MNEIFQAAGKLEEAIRGSHPGVAILVENLSSALHRQVSNIRAALPAKSAADEQRLASAAVDPEKISTALAALKELLEANDADALDAYTKLAVLLKGTVDPELSEALGAAINGFDFESALQKLDQIAKSLGKKENAPE